MTHYSILLPELIIRPIIRKDQIHEFMNKMTDEELIQRDQEIYAKLEEEGVQKIFPDWNAAYMAKQIDTDIIYKMFRDKKL